MKISQTKNRREACPRYCAIHQIHYIDECPYCSGYQKDLDKWGVYNGI